MLCLLLVGGGPCGDTTCVMSQCHWDLLKRGVVAGERDDWWCHVICLLLVYGQTVWRNYVRNPQELHTRVTHKSILKECPARV